MLQARRDEGLHVLGLGVDGGVAAGAEDEPGRAHVAVAFEESRHDALFADAGLFIDLDDDGRLNRTTEHFLDGERVWVGRESWMLSLEYP